MCVVGTNLSRISNCFTEAVVQVKQGSSSIAANDKLVTNTSKS
jgi:hypothetical protein